MTERGDAIADRAYGLGILHGLKLAEAGAWERGRSTAERLIEDGRKFLIAGRAVGEQARPAKEGK